MEVDDLVFTGDRFVPHLTGSVPEPSTWAMMLLGFGFVGGAMRAKRRKQNISVSFA